MNEPARPVVAEGGRPRLGGRRLIGGDGEPEVFCADEQSEVPIDVARWQSLAERVLVAEGVRGGAELTVLFVGRDEIAELNESYLGKSGPTDVLSFPIDGGDIVEVIASPSAQSRGPDRAPLDPGDMPLMLGDVVICPEVARDQAPDHAGTLDDELALLLVHGILHVLGHDHAEPEETARMRGREMALLSELHWAGEVPADFRQVHDDDAPEAAS
jgi:probable rRNA maturation factor